MVAHLNYVHFEFNVITYNNNCISRIFTHISPPLQFGGKLVTLDNAPSNPQQPAKHVVHVSQVVTETAFLARSDLLQATLSDGNFVDFCQSKIDAAQDGFEKTVWSFLKVRHF